MINQIEARREMIKERFNHAWSKSSTRIPIQLKEYRALLDLWEIASKMAEDEDAYIPQTLDDVLEKLEKGG